MKKIAYIALLCAVALAVDAGVRPVTSWVGPTLVDQINLAIAIQTDSSTTTTTTDYTPAYAGQILIGSAGSGTSAVWIAVGTATSDWVKVGPTD